jgi:hypothetical protein
MAETIWITVIPLDAVIIVAKGAHTLEDNQKYVRGEGGALL